MTIIPNEILVSDKVVEELNHGTSRLKGTNQFIHTLIDQGVAKVIELNERGYELYEFLICDPNSLDDGEAATIAAAATLGYIPIIDDHKAREQAESLIERKVAWSLDLFVHPMIQAGLSKADYIEAIYLALREGRMRIDEERCDAVVELIGVERALNCTSLPNFKERKRLWNENSG